MMDDKLIKDGLLHLMSIPEDKAQSAGVLFILDSRNSSDESVSRLLHIIVQICRGGKVFKAVVISSETRVHLHNTMAQLQLQQGDLTPICHCFDVPFLTSFVSMDQLTRRLGGSIKFNCELWVKAKSVWLLILVCCLKY
jgi:hypothetical protein